MESIFVLNLREPSIYVFAMQEPKHFQSVFRKLDTKPVVANSNAIISFVSLNFSDILQFGQ